MIVGHYNELLTRSETALNNLSEDPERLELNTIGSVLAATEAELKEAHYVGDVRARRIRNAAIASVLEYLSG